MYYDNKILIGKSGDEPIYIYPSMANRHGLIAGATGTGKTTTLKVMAESFSAAGVPVFLADVKGDLASIACEGVSNSNIESRVDALKLNECGFNFTKFPVNFWDVYAEKGLPLRTTISEMGPILLGRILDLNDTQSDILTIIFKIADDEGLLLIDTKDLKSMIQYIGEKREEYSLVYGNIANASLAAITRAIVALEADGAEYFFGEPALSVTDWLSTDCNGRGNIQVLDCQKLILHPKMYSTFLLWMMSELFETLPEAGDLEKPRMVFFFDEAHLLFNSASKLLLEKTEQVVKLIRSKGVGIYFITQSPADIPGGILSQLGNKVQHALRAYTPAEMKGVKAAAMSYRANPEFDTYTTLSELGTGVALISVLDESGIPTVVKKATILPPQSRFGAIDDGTRESLITGSFLYFRYHDSFDRDSAYEFFLRRSVELAEQAKQEAAELEEARLRAIEEKEAEKRAIAEEKAAIKAAEKAEKEAAKKAAAADRQKKALVSSAAKSVTGTVGRELGKSVGNSLGGSFGKKIGGNLGATLGRGVIGTLFKH